MWFFLAFLAACALTVLVVFGRKHAQRVESQIARQYPDASEEDIEALRQRNAFPVPGAVKNVLVGGIVLFMGAGLFNNVLFYAEPGYIYHVRTIFGQEKVVDDVGYNAHWFGRINQWKKAVSIVAKVNYASHDEDNVSSEVDNVVASATLGPVRTIFLDQVDAQISATARFLLPSDEEAFLRIAREYRSPDNLLRTTLLPAFRETLQANAALMGAEDYFAGGRTQFNINFEDQLEQGLFLVERIEVVRETPTSGQASANATLETEQKEFGDDQQVVFKVEKIVDEAGVPLRKEQSYKVLGITVVESRITDVVPNQKFNERMQLKQKASADRAIAREQRIQEEEQRLLAEAKGEREVAERKAQALVQQIEQTTNAETDKQLALTEATKLKEQAEIDRETSAIRLEQAKIDAERQRTLADAEAYEREVILAADNALQAKLDAEVQIQAAWAEAYSKRPVPQTVFGSGGGQDGAPTGSTSEVSTFLQLKTAEAANNLNYDRSVEKEK